MMAAFARWSLETALEDIAQGLCKVAGSTDPRILTMDVRQIPLRFSPTSVGTFRARMKGVESRAVEEYLAQLIDNSDAYLVDGYFPWGGRTVHVLVRLKRGGNGECRPLGATVLRFL